MTCLVLPALHCGATLQCCAPPLSLSDALVLRRGTFCGVSPYPIVVLVCSVLPSHRQCAARIGFVVCLYGLTEPFAAFGEIYAAFAKPASRPSIDTCALLLFTFLLDGFADQHRKSGCV